MLQDIQMVCVVLTDEYGLSVTVRLKLLCVVFSMESVKLTPCLCVSRAMSSDEHVYLGILAASIPVGFLLRYLSE